MKARIKLFELLSRGGVLEACPWPRGHILKSLALASRPQVLENWPVLGPRTALFFEWLKFVERLKTFLENVFLWRLLEKFL